MVELCINIPSIRIKNLFFFHNIITNLCAMSDLLEIEKLIADELGVAISNSASLDDLKSVLAEKFNDLINTDFNHLVYLLYRIDINEEKLKQALKQNEGKDTAVLLADLTIERQLQKIRSREDYRKDESISDDEKW